jgi:hypothetical protein
MSKCLDDSKEFSGMQISDQPKYLERSYKSPAHLKAAAKVPQQPVMCLPVRPCLSASSLAHLASSRQRPDVPCRKHVATSALLCKLACAAD